MTYPGVRPDPKAPTYAPTDFDTGAGQTVEIRDGCGHTVYTCAGTATSFGWSVAMSVCIFSYVLLFAFYIVRGFILLGSFPYSEFWALLCSAMLAQADTAHRCQKPQPHPAFLASSCPGPMHQVAVPIYACNLALRPARLPPNHQHCHPPHGAAGCRQRGFHRPLYRAAVVGGPLHVLQVRRCWAGYGGR